MAKVDHILASNLISFPSDYDDKLAWACLLSGVETAAGYEVTASLKLSG